MSLTTIDFPQVLKFISKYYPDIIKNPPEKSMFKLIEEKGFPTRRRRWCCQLLKEVNGQNSVVVTGVRKEESEKRELWNEQGENCKMNKIILNPILEWTELEVWEFIKKYIGYWCELYDQGFKRIGCLLCPMTSYKNKINELRFAPKFEYAFKKAIKKRMENKEYWKNIFNNDIDLAFEWYLSGISIRIFLEKKKQLHFDFKNISEK